MNMMYRFFIVLLGLGVIVTCASGFHKIPLYRSPGLKNRMLQESVERIDSRRTLDLTLENLKNLQYYADVTVGSPPQPAVAAFDTGSADVWVLSEQCSTIACKKHSRYDSSSSGSYEANGTTINIHYGQGSVEGILCTDSMTVADVNFKQTFVEAQWVADDLMNVMQFDAIVGMGFRSISVSGVPTMFENVMAATSIPPIFSFYFNRDPTATNGGLLTLGGLNQSHFLGDLYYVPLVTSTYWLFTVEYIHVGNFELSTGYSEAIADTGSSFMSAPADIAWKLYEAIQATQIASKTYQTVNCATAAYLPALIFTISGKQFPVESSDYIIRMDTKSGPVCLVGVKRSSEPHWVIGDIFLGRYYSVYDVSQKRIGFAEAVHPFIG